jgi:hypothetical protein
MRKPLLLKRLSAAALLFTASCVLLLATGHPSGGWNYSTVAVALAAVCGWIPLSPRPSTVQEHTP